MIKMVQLLDTLLWECKGAAGKLGLHHRYNCLDILGAQPFCMCRNKKNLKGGCISVLRFPLTT